MISPALRQAKSLWSYNPIPGGCVLYLPLWHPSLGGLKFKSIDPYGLTCTRTASGVLHFTGSAMSNVNVGAIHDATDKLWISFWFRLDTAIPSGGDGTTYHIFGKYDNSTNYWVGQISSGDGKFYLLHTEGAGVDMVVSAETAWDVGWHHIVCSCSTVEGQRLIVDGGTAVTDAGNQTAISLTAVIVLGNRTDGGPSGLIGEMKEVVIGTDDLSAPEEAALYAGTLPGDETEYWPMDEGSGDYCYDQEGTADADGDIDDACTWENVPMHSRPDGHYFDGLDDQLIITDAASRGRLDFGTADFSFYGWIRVGVSAQLRWLFRKTGVDPRYLLQLAANGTLLSLVDDGVTTVSAASVGTVDDSVWHLVGAEFDRDGNIQNYIDTGADGNAAIGAVGNIDNGNDLRMGLGVAGGGSWQIGEMWVWRKLLSTAERAYLYNQTKGRYL